MHRTFVISYPCQPFKLEPDKTKHVHQRRECRWGRPVTALQTAGKETAVNTGAKTKTYGLSEVITSATNPGDQDLRGLLSGVEKYNQR